jgi:hypothetical protein
MKNVLDDSQVPMPPVFMATTRQKILFKEQNLPHSFFEIQHPRTMHALNYISDFAKEVVNLAKGS